MFQENCFKYLSLVLLVFLFQACATPGKSWPPMTIMSPPVPGKGDDVVTPGSLRSIGVAKSGDFSGGFGLYTTDTTLLEHDPGGFMETHPLLWPLLPVIIPIAAETKKKSDLSEEEAKKLIFLAKDTLGYESVQEEMVQKVVQHGLKYGSSHLEAFDLNCAPDTTCDDEFWERVNFDAILEIKVLRLGLMETWNKYRPLQFVMEGWTRLIRTNDNRVIRIRPFSLRGRSLTLKQWLDEAEDTLLLSTDGEKGNLAKWYEIHLDQLARMIVQAMIYQPDTVPVHDRTYCWIKPLELAGEKTLLPKASPVYTTTPVLRWEPFSKVGNRTITGPNVPVEITHVTYDFKLSWFKDHRWQSMEESGLKEPVYVVSEPLEKNTVYYWTVRANFLENGTSRRTDWSHRIYEKIPPGWRNVKTEGEETLWPMEWNLTREELKAIPEDILKGLVCISRPDFTTRIFSDYHNRFKVMENDQP
jgi:hypothetical protein